MMTEQQPYDIVRRYDSFELRRYPAHVLAEVTVDGAFEDAGNRAFRFLFGYISGDNRARQKVAMTAPVVQADASAKIAMTAPVVQEAQDASQFRVAFVLPASLTIETAPEPTSPQVQLRAVPQSVAAALRFGGRWSEDSYERHLDELVSAIADAGLTAVGSPRFARFDPPFMPWFLRRNEVILDIAESS
jgi:hypothetical protein